jgi:hypothetical protein
MPFLLVGGDAVIMKRLRSANVKNRRSWEKAGEELKPMPAFWGRASAQ